MDSIRALGARYFDLNRSDRIAVAICAVVALAALLAVAKAPTGRTHIGEQEATEPEDSAEPLTGLAMSRQLNSDHAGMGQPNGPATAIGLSAEPGRGVASGLTLLVSLPIGIWMGFLAARRWRASGPLSVAPVEPVRDDSAVITDEVTRLQRSLRRRDRRIAALKKRLETAAVAPPSKATAVPDSVARLELELGEARAAVQRLEELLQDKQDDWAQSEMVTARSDSRIAALEADLKAAGEIIESLHEDIGYWKRRAVQTPPDSDLIDRLTG